MKAKIAPFISPVAIAIALFFSVALTRGATVTVTNTNDSGAGSLREALIDASDGDTITFAVSGTIGLTSGELLVIKNVTIEGPGAARLAVDGNATSRVFHISSGKTVTISGLTISNGYVSGDFAGGGIYNEDNATLTLSNCTVSGNYAVGTVYCCDPWCDCAYGSGGYGGGIYNDGTLTLSNCTISGNVANTYGYGDGDSSGGGIYNGSANLTISNCTISGNEALAAGGNIYLYGGVATVFQIGNTILKAGASGGNIFNQGGGTIISQGYNLSSDNGAGLLTGPGDQINTDPMLGPLRDNGGPTFTHELLTGSPAINAGNPNFTPPPFYDQRGPGFDRVRNGRIDIGSFEVQGPVPTPTPTPTPPDVITLTTSIGPKSNGKNTVKLSWTGANVRIIDILRNGALLGTTQNTGSYTDYIPVNKRGTYTYKVCETGTSICSNEATVTFR